MKITLLTLWVASAVASSLMCAMIARDKHRSAAAWLVIGLVCNLPALAVLVRLRPVPHDDRK